MNGPVGGHCQYKAKFWREKIEKFYSFQRRFRIRSGLGTKFHYWLDAGIPL